MKKCLVALWIGLIFGIVDAFLVMNLDPNWNYYSLATVIILWPIVSLVISESRLWWCIWIKKGIIWSLVLNLPWAVHFISLWMGDFFLPVLVIAMIYGALIWLLNLKFNN